LSDDVSKLPEDRRGGSSVLVTTRSCSASGILMAVFGGGFSGENMGNFCSNPGLGILFGFVVGGSCVPIGGKMMSGRVNGGGELCGLRGCTSCSGVTEEVVVGGFGIPGWMFDR